LPADAPWEKAQNVPARAKPPAPTSGIDKRRRNLVIGLVAFFVLGPALIAGINFFVGDDDEEVTQQITPADEETILNERREAERVINAAIAEIRGKYAGQVAPQTIMAHMEERFAKGEFETAHYRVAQATLTRRKGPNAYDVIVVCVPKDTATNKRASGYAEFRWAADQPIKLEWR
jgi:hypothetical protein